MRYTQGQKEQANNRTQQGWRGEGKFYVGHTYRPQVACARDLGHWMPDEHDLCSYVYMCSFTYFLTYQVIEICFH
jgi:hypothetical protein